MAISVAQFLTLFYYVPIETSFQSIAEVPDYVGKAVPFFFLLILAEWIYGLCMKSSLYSFKDVIMSMSLGTTQQLLTIPLKSLRIVPYQIVYHYFHGHVAPSTTSTGHIIRFLGGFLGCDLVYYIFHRVAHEYHYIWSAHGVHHSGERYNFATALRQGIFQTTFSWLFYLPLAFLGVHPIDFIRHDRLNTVYQFWIHTELINKLPLLLEMFLNTPSHHRIHHRPPGNCNYAGVLIIWDRIFNTFQYEVSNKTSNEKIDTNIFKEKTVIYGLAKPLNSFNPIYANIQHFIKIYESQKLIHKSNVLLNTIKLVFLKKRVLSIWEINVTFESLFPEITNQTSIFDFINPFQLFALPTVTDSNIIEYETQKLTLKSSNMNVSANELLFVKERSKREGKPLKWNEFLVISVQFVVTTAVSYYMMLHGTELLNSQNIMDKLIFLLVVTLCVVSLNVIYKYYQPQSPQDKKNS